MTVATAIRISEPAHEDEVDELVAEHWAEIEAIAADPAAPDFDNTIAAMERSGRVLKRVGALFSNLARAHVTSRRGECVDLLSRLVYEQGGAPGAAWRSG